MTHLSEDGLLICHLHKLEKLSIEAQKAVLDVQFLKNCLKLNVSLKFISVLGTSIHAGLLYCAFLKLL